MLNSGIHVKPVFLLYQVTIKNNFIGGSESALCILNQTAEETRKRLTDASERALNVRSVPSRFALYKCAVHAPALPHLFMSSSFAYIRKLTLNTLIGFYCTRGAVWSGSLSRIPELMRHISFPSEPPIASRFEYSLVLVLCARACSSAFKSTRRTCSEYSSFWI